MSNLNRITEERSEAHVRLTPDEIKELWEMGRLTSTGLLYLLIRASRRDGWKFRIDNVRQFCKDYKIPKTSFYRAKATLIKEGVLLEEIHGAVDLWIPSDVVQFPATIPAKEKCPKLELVDQIRESENQIEPSAFQIRESSTTQNLAAVESCEPSRSLTNLNRSFSEATDPKPEREIQQADPTQDDEPLIEWIGKQSKTARNPRAYALKCLNTDRPYWEKAYREQLESKSRAIVPPPRSTAEELYFPQPDLTNSELLDRYQGMWLYGNRSRVEAEVMGNPGLGFEITEQGVERCF